MDNIQQRRQTYQKPDGPRIPEDLKLPYPLYKAVRKDNPSYINFWELLSSGKLTEAKAIKDKLIRAYEAKVQVQRAELLLYPINVEDILGEVNELRMGPMDLAKEVSLDNDIDPDFEIYLNVVPAILPDLTPTTVEQVINRKGPVQGRDTSPYIFTDYGA